MAKANGGLSSSILRLSRLSSGSFKHVMRFMTPDVKYGGMDRWMVRGVKPTWFAYVSTVLYDIALWQLTMYVILLYLAMSAVLALLLYPAYVHSAASFAGDVPEGFSPVVAIFCMSLGALTQTSVSISELSPASYYTIAVVTMGHFYGIIMSAAVLGALINRASIPQARVVFSDNCLFSSRNGEPVLMFRIGNTRGNFLLNPEIRIGLLQAESTIEGENIMRMTRLDFDEPPSMAPSVNVACRITPDSPLSGQTYWDLESEGAAICVSVSATDNQHFQEVFARKIYLVQDMRFNCRFADVMKTTTNGTKAVDFRKFNMIIQNTMMPVTYGLSPEDSAIINGTTGAGAALRQPDLTQKKTDDVRPPLWNPHVAAAGFMPAKPSTTEDSAWPEKRLQSSSLSHASEKAGQGHSQRYLDVDSSTSHNDELSRMRMRSQMLRLGLATELSDSANGSDAGSVGAEGCAAAHPGARAAADAHIPACDLPSRSLKAQDRDGCGPVLDVERSIAQAQRPRPLPMHIAPAESDGSANDDLDMSDAAELHMHEREADATELASQQPLEKQQARSSAPTAVLAGGSSMGDTGTSDLGDVGEASGTALPAATTGPWRDQHLRGTVPAELAAVAWRSRTVASVPEKAVLLMSSLDGEHHPSAEMSQEDRRAQLRQLLFSGQVPDSEQMDRMDSCLSSLSASSRKGGQMDTQAKKDA